MRLFHFLRLVLIIFMFIITLEPTRYIINGVYEDVPENQIVSGETYRVDIVLFDREQKVIYRQREYVTMP